MGSYIITALFIDLNDPWLDTIEEKSIVFQKIMEPLLDNLAILILDFKTDKLPIAVQCRNGRGSRAHKGIQYQISRVGTNLNKRDTDFERFLRFMFRPFSPHTNGALNEIVHFIDILDYRYIVPIR